MEDSEMIREVKFAQNGIRFDSIGALDLSVIKQSANTESEFTWQCDVCGDKATGKF